MKTYTVLVGGKFNTYIDVEANNAEEAESKAVKEVRKNTDLIIEYTEAYESKGE